MSGHAAALPRAAMNVRRFVGPTGMRCILPVTSNHSMGRRPRQSWEQKTIASGVLLKTTNSYWYRPSRRRKKSNRANLSALQLAWPFKMVLPSFAQHMRVLETSNIVLSQKAGRVHH
jgi:hypothetical protein